MCDVEISSALPGVRSRQAGARRLRAKYRPPDLPETDMHSNTSHPGRAITKKKAEGILSFGLMYE
jgi:hypothetical protein